MLTAIRSSSTIRLRARAGTGASLALVLALVAAACGDNQHAPAGDGGTGTADAGGDRDASPGATAFAVATDYSTTGVASTVAIPSLDVKVGAVAGVASTDPVVRHLGQRIYIVNRFGQDNVTVLDDSDLSLVAQISTGAGSDPQDVAAVGNQLFVAALSSSGVLVLDVTRPDDGVLETIDLSALDPDGIPNCHSVVAVGNQLAVICGVLDDANQFTPRGPGAVAIIDAAKHQVITTFALSQERPVGFALATPRSGMLGGDVLVPSVSDYSSPASGGCVERVTVAGQDSADHGCLVDNATLNGYASALAYDKEFDQVWLSVTTSFDPNDFGPHGYAAALDVARGRVGEAITPATERPMDLALCPTGNLVISDATKGVRIFTRDRTKELTDQPLDIGFPPVSGGIACY